MIFFLFFFRSPLSRLCFSSPFKAFAAISLLTAAVTDRNPNAVYLKPKCCHTDREVTPFFTVLSVNDELRIVMPARFVHKILQIAIKHLRNKPIKRWHHLVVFFITRAGRDKVKKSLEM